jgi:hypothetical protein
MKKNSVFLALLLTTLLAGGARADFNFDDKMQELMTDVMSNPSAFLSEFQQDMEATTPLAPGKTVALQTGLFPTTIPFTFTNISGKYMLHPEGNWSPGMPQIDLIGGYWGMAWSGLLANQNRYINDVSLSGYYAGLLATSSISPRLRVFGGLKRSRVHSSMTLQQPITVYNVPVNNFDSTFMDDFVIAGVEQEITLDKWWSMQVDYGTGSKNPAAKVSWYGKNFEVGLNIYPEGVITFQPVWNFHVEF